MVIGGEMSMQCVCVELERFKYIIDITSLIETHSERHSGLIHFTLCACGGGNRFPFFTVRYIVSSLLHCRGDST